MAHICSIFRILHKSEHALTATTLESWHQRLNHLPKDLVKRMANNGAVEGLKIVSHTPDDCLDCKLNKCTRTSHPLRSTIKACKPAHALHFDIVGHIRPEGVLGQRFILVCRDKFTSFRQISTLKTKGMSPEAVKIAYANVSQSIMQTGNDVLRITSDNGTEFTSERLSVFLEQKGIQHVLSAPYARQQNPKRTVERENRSLLDQSRTILNSSKLDQEMWPDAVATSTYVANRCIIQKRNVTPYQLWFGKKPNINNLDLFGQQAFVLKPDHVRSKFDEKCTIMVFVGYTENYQTFKFFDYTNRKYVISCDAVFIDRIGTKISDEPAPEMRESSPERETFDFSLKKSLPSTLSSPHPSTSPESQADKTFHSVSIDSDICKPAKCVW